MSDTGFEPLASTAAASLLLQMLAWIAARPRSYAETMDAWRTSCPRLSVWEDAEAAGLVRVDATGTGGQSNALVRLTERGTARLRASQATAAGGSRAG